MVTQNCGIIFFTENLTELFSCIRACAASRPTLVERWTLNGVFVLRPITQFTLSQSITLNFSSSFW